MTPAERVAIREAIAKLEQALAEDDEPDRCPVCGAHYSEPHVSGAACWPAVGPYEAVPPEVVA